MGACRELGIVLRQKSWGNLSSEPLGSHPGPETAGLCFMLWVQMCCHHIHDESHLRKVKYGYSAIAELPRGVLGP